MTKKHEPLFETNSDQPRRSIDPLFEEEKTVNTAIAVDAKITPISKKEVPQVDAALWDELSVPDLYDQLAILETRVMYCNQFSQGEAAKQIGVGIVRLRAIIAKKVSTEVKLL